ncbi:FAD-dependent cmnm(5)s(2)U34 oxidoreductase [Rhodoferax koreense]|uniref:tRNA 5-methylaminomethyl-2-thiouridine biosynthesis bifunctional protein MnmC n=1 Tax=Rhodoferax koreensis TaxID=1842727 RepID=A0A1P8JWB6_9BURK|nr:FAD-dependent 5-carboxymethylaminomethyl-2-thiouridine(34) oxidoreductase MnmC [Rhodoferax koreense]APW37971.1 FAD-dependent cmnm(5)s(2)U34 oxidoreductase [Rhodoferax koreense]
MAEPIEWMADGTPYSPRFNDRYRSELGGLSQAREVFLQGCGLPEAWAGAQRWSVLETGFGLGLNFLVTWDAWRRDPVRPRILHFVSIEAWPASADDLLRSFAVHPELRPLAEQLHSRWWGLLPGWHRLVFEGGQVVLTLCIGDVQAMLREMAFEADAVYLDGFSPDVNPDIWSAHTMKAVARCCRRGTRVASWTVARSVRDGLKQAGFVVRKTAGVPPKRHNLQAVYDPHWTPKRTADPALAVEPSTCIVIGAGIAGASVAHSLARRGWRVRLLDAAEAPATGASGLPAGLVAPHVSVGDSVLSQLSRAGVRTTLQLAAPLLRAGVDWAPDGVLQRHLGNPPKLPTDATEFGRDWSAPATPEQLAEAGLPEDAAAHWHAHGGWLRPKRLVEALLSHPGIRWQGRAAVDRLEHVEAGWRVVGTEGETLATAPLVVVAAGIASSRIGATAMPLQPVRGQVACGASAAPPGAFPRWPVNGHGSFISGMPLPGGERLWVAGASFDRHQADPSVQAADTQANFERLAGLLPAVAEALAPAFETGQVQAWAGIRCASPDRLPMVGPLGPPGLWVCTAMGSRGLTMAMLCGELLAARLHGEPLPLTRKLAAALGVGRYLPSSER